MLECVWTSHFHTYQASDLEKDVPTNVTTGSTLDTHTHTQLQLHAGPRRCVLGDQVKVCWLSRAPFLITPYTLAPFRGYNIQVHVYVRFT